MLSDGQPSEHCTPRMGSEEAIPAQPEGNVSASAASVGEAGAVAKASGDDGKASPLMTVVAAGDLDAVEALLKAGHDATEQSDDTGMPLVKADLASNFRELKLPFDFTD